MPTQIEAARAGRVTPEMAAVAAAEGRDGEAIARDVAAGVTVLPWNLRRRRGAAAARGIGRALRVKTNANIGTSRDSCDLERERAKLRASESAGADSVMDLSTAGDLRAIRKALIAETELLFGSVPIYEAAVEAVEASGSVLDMTPESMLAAVRRHAEDGVDFATIHAGVTRRAIAPLGDIDSNGSRRGAGIVSRGGAFLARWMIEHGEENPYYERYDQLLELSREFDLTISIGDGLRPGAVADAGDEAQLAELVEIASLVARAREAGVQTIVEGPGHVPLDQVRAQVELAKTVTGGAPLYVLGPLVTDVAAGHDHIAAAIGGALAGWAGADFLCVVTPAEHLALPGPGEVREGVIAARIAAHAAELARGGREAREWDAEVSRLRRARDWEGMLEKLLDPERARCIRSSGPPADPETCSMCGPYCVLTKPAR
ncbi:MAG: phosphomethylpyrimidine synthase ThiC [Planctomycetota bacterium]